MKLRKNPETGEVTSYDVEPKDVLIPVGWCGLVATVLVVIILLIIAGAVHDNYKQYQRQTEYAKVYNMLNITDRQALAEYHGYDNVDSTSYYMTPQVGLPVREWFQVNTNTIVVVILSVMCSLISLIALSTYAGNKQDEYFYADFPEWWGQRWILPVITLPFCWVYLISYYRMRRWMAKRAEEESKIQIIYVDEDQPAQAIDSTLIRSYGGFYKGVKESTHKARIKQIDKTRQELRERIKTLQQSLREVEERALDLDLERARLAETNRQGYTLDEDRAKADLAEISQIRGVTEVCTTTVATKGNTYRTALDVRFKLRLTVESVTYRIGEGQMILSRTDKGVNLDLRLLESGCIRGLGPSYFSNFTKNGAGEYYSGFCFGGRKDQIQKYLDAGEFVAAISLIMDNLHQLPQDRLGHMSRCYQQVVTQAEYKRRFVSN